MKKDLTKKVNHYIPDWAVLEKPESKKQNVNPALTENYYSKPYNRNQEQENNFSYKHFF